MLLLASFPVPNAFMYDCEDGNDVPKNPDDIVACDAKSSLPFCITFKLFVPFNVNCGTRCFGGVKSVAGNIGIAISSLPRCLALTFSIAFVPVVFLCLFKAFFKDPAGPWRAAGAPARLGASHVAHLAGRPGTERVSGWHMEERT